jgi:transposase-like protein
VCAFEDCGGSEVTRFEVKASTRKNGRYVAPRSLFKCKACKRQFSVTKGTIFEDSHIPLRTWLMVAYRMCSSKTSVSALQIQREFGLASYESAWFMCHRIRYAMTDKNPSLLSGVVEADETYIGGKPRGHAKMRAAKYTMSERITEAKRKKTPVFGIKERGGRVIAQAIPAMTQKKVERALWENVDHTSARLMSDEAPYYYWMKNRLPHDVIRHSSEYVRGDIHTQSIESFWSILKRGLTGTYFHVDAGYLNQYVQEYAFRHNTRRISDTERFDELMRNVGGRVDWYVGKSKRVSGPVEIDEPEMPS